MLRIFFGPDHIANMLSDFCRTAIAIAATTKKSEKERLLACGFDGYLSKPLRPQDLVQLVLSSAAQAPVAV